MFLDRNKNSRTADKVQATRNSETINAPLDNKETLKSVAKSQSSQKSSIEIT